KQVYESKADDLAFSPPAWDPAGKRMVFTVARALDGKQPVPAGDTPANGRLHAPVPVRYTRWLYDPPTTNAPEKLFDAACNPAGYVAAGLAVSWHPDGRKLDYVDQAAPQRHRVVAFDLAARKAEPVPLPPAEYIVLGSSPGVPHRFALLS